jgi:hypothetical protein
MGVGERLVLPSMKILRKILSYDPATGVLRKRGKIVGANSRKNGARIIVRIENVKYIASRVIWKLQTGKDPGWKEIDHKDGDESNASIGD